MHATSQPLVIENFPPLQRSLRIAVVTETYPPEVNGVALTVDRLVRGLQARNHDLQLVRPRQARLEQGGATPGFEQVLLRGLPIPRYPHLRMGMPAKKPLTAMWTLRRPDLVHVATEGPLGWSALQAARKLKLPVSTDFRTNFHAYSRHYGMGWLEKPIAAYLRKFHNLAHCTMVPTPGLQTELAALGFERLLVVARGVDTQRFLPARRSAALRAQWGVAPDELVALSVGRLAAEKNLHLLAQAHAAMRAVNPRCRLVVVGDGPERDAFEQACPDAIFAGSRSGTDLADHYASADVFLFPSLTETYGNVTPEALASGLAVLAFDHAAAAELIRHGHNGLLAPFGDADAFVRRAADLAGDPALVQHLRAAARASTLALDWSQIVAQVEAVWLRLLRQHAEGAGAPQPGALRWGPPVSGA
ncbi:glycosyltransferase family 1 protein [Aquabacterium sp. A08]|uniref:glycosyltransferase family 4 protein n=1 Tax=Aquabacterium sp. A08 TaxID=2718532 RepID=UPI00142446E7|nr:glycosyltransferase family 1 protein [Aquabacterium sp. A08]NIC40097.1 glycosyltransferase family 1 protein [Aquabacterium sp. A08]